MKKYLISFFVLAIIIFLHPSASFGNGFIIGEQDAEAMGGASAFAARASNPSAIFYNPAGITQLDGINMTLGTNLVTVKTTYNKSGGGDKSSTKDRLDTPSYFYVTGKINDKFATGFGFYQPFGLASDWQSGWPGRHIVTYAMLKTFFFNPVIAWQPTKNLSIGVGGIGVYSDVVLNSRLVYENLAAASIPGFTPGTLTGIEGHSKLKGDGGGAGINAGGLYSVTDNLKIGLSYRSPIRIRYSGRTEFNKANSANSPTVALINATLFNSRARTKITMPPQLLAGVSYNISKNLTAEFDIDWRGWSRSDTLRIQFRNKRMKNVKISQQWKDTVTYRAGLEYRLNNNLALRGGYAYDPSTVPNNRLDPMVPDADKHAVTLGLGYKLGKWKFDISNMAIFFEEASTRTARVGFNNMFRFNAKYNSYANIVSMSVGYKF
ncbi:MAG: hypothetical protein A2043_05360 [Candidatus Schekmanbacteria bacterium GWA2_38_9]|uniref:Aromatic hydrocarbon degradation protein n=1 Tax=Candidatus Schekmanbacteria bacterium RIFCSPLOWO2_12_FULL_38_15 TaxID=1817883 RepID=A0A1F7SNU5_9BACT|nr:MAG: hypothetical protein A2043_05360 [Candidatus Schekmanbacteria bacterium GWA2_38_9]OGL50229.1 MAG: hypothetical protein A3H37_00545 [Candidatus Schekmanbacteria bacterium RIFCSPLOWO2_02_FULL_38_14]OGL55460.1 MAG: hypothetical protein A3G31_01455 [Candidatus Schekmanbacteria bacterium RIFCSPLOWO2_12_FULL_38_15]